MSFDPEVAAIRFGYGLSPSIAAPQSAEAMLLALKLPDVQAQRHPIPSFEDVFPYMQELTVLAKARREAKKKSVADFEAENRRFQKHRKTMRLRRVDWFMQSLLRTRAANDAFRERLVRFWADHFTAIGKGNRYEYLASTFVEDAIRPHVTGRFADILKASSTHPVMLNFLDQFASSGEKSELAMEGRGSLNENLGREILELHTLGVSGAYSQADVREFSNLLAGFRLNREGKVVYAKRAANPGPELVLGKHYGGEAPLVDDVHEALEDFARHPDTARHIARKLAMHFVSDNPDPELVAKIEAAYLNSDGNLMALYEALLTHPAAWAPDAQKIKQPFDFVASTFRALDTPLQTLAKTKLRQRQFLLLGPLRVMGQKWERPNGPDGWPDDVDHWSTPQSLGARIQWAMHAPQVLSKPLPDPREFVANALGSRASEATRFAAYSAETRREGVGLILSAPEFQKR